MGGVWGDGGYRDGGLGEVMLGPAGGRALVHEGEEDADDGGDEGVHGLVEQLGGEDAPDEEVVAQGRHQQHVEDRRHRPQQRKAVAAVAQRCTTPAAGEIEG